jgi:hypothetical protein
VSSARWSRAAIIVFAAIGLVALTRSVADTAPESDFAVLDIHVLNVVRDLQPVGAYSRFGWNHPGPLYFQLLAPQYVASGSRQLSIPIGAAIINAGCLVALLAIVMRHSRGRGMLVAAIVLLAMFLWRAWDLVASPWNPHVPILPLALLIVAGAAVAAGTMRLLPLVVGVASFVVQAHVGVALTAAVVVALATLMAAASAWRDRVADGEVGSGPPREFRRALSLATIVGALVWALPIADALGLAPSGGGRNLQRIYAFIGTQPRLPSKAADRIFASRVIAPFGRDSGLAWGDSIPPPPPSNALAVAEVQAALLVVATIVSAMRRHRFDASLGAIAFAAALAALYSMRQLPAEPSDHMVGWVSIVGVLCWMVPAGLAIDLARPRAEGDRAAVWPRALLPAAAIVIVVGASVQVADFHRRFERSTPRIRGLTDLVRARLAATGARNPLVHVTQDLWEVAAGVVLQLARDDVRPFVDADWVSMFGPAYTPSGGERVEIRFASGAEHSDDLRFRTEYDRLGEAGGVYVYQVVAPPTAREDVPRIVEESAAIGSGATGLADGVWPDDGDAAFSGGAVAFTGFDQFVTVDVPPDTLGVRLHGQAGTIWQLRCTAGGEEFHRMGRVTIPQNGGGSQTGTSFVGELATCRQLKIAPAIDGQTWYLSEVRLLRK